MKLFVSHSSKDSGFVSLLMALLDFHHVDAWCSTRNLAVGVEFRREIDVAVRAADALLVVVSRNAAASKWVTKEIATFQALKPTAAVVPLILDDADPNTVIDQLYNHHAIDFGEDMLAGFQALLRFCGREFLEKRERRSATPAEARRVKQERRSARITQRLRTGCWKAVESARALGRFDPMMLSMSELYRTAQAIVPEAEKYEFRAADGSLVAPSEAVESAAHQVWDEWRPREPVKSIVVIEAIAELLAKSYVVRIPERREGLRRKMDDSPATERRAQQETRV